MLLERALLQELAIEEITSADRAEALRSEWNNLWERCPHATPFQTPEWQLAWWNAFGADKKLWLVLLRDQVTKRLVALLPAMILPGENKLMFIGAAVSDELDMLAELELAHPAARTFLSQVRNARHRWSHCELAPLPESSPLRQGATVHDVMPVVDLSQPLSVNMRRNLRQYRRRAEKIGTVDFESASERNFDELFDALVDLHCARWHRQNQPGVLCESTVRKFHTRAARALLRRGIARVLVLRVNGRIVAGFYGFLCRGQMRSYIGGFDPDLSQLSPGTLIIGHAMEQARREGARTFSFLRGAERYKYLWGAKDSYVYTRRLAP